MERSCYHFNRGRKGILPNLTFIPNTLNDLEIEGHVLKLMNDFYEKPKANIMLNGQKLNAFLQHRNKSGVFPHDSHRVLYWMF